MKSIDLLKSLDKMKTNGIWLSGVEYEGEFRKWYYNGQQWVISNWKNGKKHGEYKCWYENGQQWTISNWENGKRHGEYKYWYENGELLEHKIYENDKLIKDLLK